MPHGYSSFVTTKIRDQLPSFSRVDHLGRTITDAGLRGKWAVIFFYPKDNTPVCTAQSCGFRDGHERLAALGAVVVVGVSRDSDDSHRAFAAKHALPYPMISDADGSLSTLFGVPKWLGFIPGRVTYVADPSGVVRGICRSWLNGKAHARFAERTIEAASRTSPAAR